jgi:hypothetical protein
MLLTRHVRRAAVLGGVAALAAGLVVTPGGTRADQRLVSDTHPTNAGKVFRWGVSQWHDGFVERLGKPWVVNRPKHVDDQHGMLTLNGLADGKDVTATLTGHAHRYGRWETRVRAHQDGTGAAPFQVVAERIPVGPHAYHCGAQNIQLAGYRLGTRTAHLAIRTLPSTQFTAGLRRDLGPGRFHTYAVEVTPTHVSWFVDTRVIRTERNKDALSGARYTVRYRLVGDQGARTNPGRMQMDWVRYYTLDRPNARSIKAPAAHRGTYKAAC